MITNSLIAGSLTAPTKVFTASTNGEPIPAGSRQTTAITTMILCNVGVPDITDETVNLTTINIFLVKDGGTPDTATFSNMIVNRLRIPAGETVFFSDERMVLDGGDTVWVGSDVPNLVAITVSSLPV